MDRRSSLQPIGCDWDSASDLDSSHSNPLFDDFDDASARYPPFRNQDMDIPFSSAPQPTGRPAPVDIDELSSDNISNSDASSAHERLMKSMLGSDELLSTSPSPLSKTKGHRPKPKSMMSLLTRGLPLTPRKSFDKTFENPLLTAEENTVSPDRMAATEEDIPNFDDMEARRECIEQRRQKFHEALQEKALHEHVVGVSAKQLDLERHRKTFEDLVLKAK